MEYVRFLQEACMILSLDNYASKFVDKETLKKRKREVSALISLNKIDPLKRAMIITYDEEETIVEQGLTIEVLPIWK